MKNKHKIILISTVIIILVIICTIIYFISKNTSKVSETNKLEKIYQKMVQNEKYKFELNLDSNNRKIISRKGNMANIDVYNNGKHTTNIVKDGNTILLIYSTQKYYMYQNNEIQLIELTNELDKVIQSQEAQKGEEIINNKTYKYEEYNGVDYFLLDANTTTNKDNIKTRFYFKGDDLKYIKTIIGEKEELIQVDISYNIENGIFEIPNNFKEG